MSRTPKQSRADRVRARACELRDIAQGQHDALVAERDAHVTAQATGAIPCPGHPEGEACTCVAAHIAQVASLSTEIAGLAPTLAVEHWLAQANGEVD